MCDSTVKPVLRMRNTVRFQNGGLICTQMVLFLLLVRNAVIEYGGTTGPSLMGEILGNLCKERRIARYFYGSKEETLELLYQKLTSNYPESNC